MTVYILLSSILVSSSAQILFKIGAVRMQPNFDKGILQGVFSLLNIQILSGVLLQVLALLLWIYALRKADVSYAYPFTAIGIILVMFQGHFLLNEELSMHRWFAVGIILLGILLLSKS